MLYSGLIVRDAEMAQVFHRGFAAAGVRGHGNGAGSRFAGPRRSGHDLGTVSGRGGMLERDFFSSAQTYVDLRVWPRIDSRHMGLAVWRKS